ncbi:bifunctional DNA primase/polymerase [Kitasatospora herbaricolor]|uniref:bifunctional DNA primase/polymerase n=1 Tax=Kitasatospora herbaricolor TaxID=68217 RepID=UPI0036DF0FD9
MIGSSAARSSVGTPSAALESARWCAAQGWPVHPLSPGSKTPAGNCAACEGDSHSAVACGCRAAGRWCHGFLGATTDHETLTAWWEANPGFGVGVSCGPAGLVVIDVDVHPTPVPGRDRILPGIPIHAHVDLTGLANGYDTLALLAALRGEPSPANDDFTLRVRTPSGGLHIWYRVSTGTVFRSSTGTGKNRALAWQVDVRAHGGYIIAPGTRVRTGVYDPVGLCRTPAPLPAWLAQELARTGHLDAPRPITKAHGIPPRARQAVVAAGGGRTAAARALETVLTEVTDCAGMPEGAGFNSKLNRAAYTAGGLVAGGYLSQGEAERHLLNAATYARPAETVRITATIRSAMAAGSRAPLHPEGP